MKMQKTAGGMKKVAGGMKKLKGGEKQCFEVETDEDGKVSVKPLAPETETAPETDVNELDGGKRHRKRKTAKKAKNSSKKSRKSRKAKKSRKARK